MISKNCKECGTAFDTKRSHTMYCSDKCKMEAFKKNKALGNPPMLPAPPQKPETVREIKTPQGFDIATQFAFNQQAERIQDLKADLKEKQEEIKKLNADRDKLKEELISAQSEITAKPGGLQGFVSSNPSIVEKAMDMFGPKLLGFIEKLEQKQNGDHPVWNWLLNQTPEVQQDFVDLIEGLNQKPDKIRDYLAEFKRNLIAVNAVKQVQPQNQRLGRG